MNSSERIYYPFHENATVEAVVVHCSDPRFQEAFHGFVRNELDIKYPAPIIIPGSVSSVSLDMVMPKRVKALREYVEFMAELGKDPRIVIINHEDCRMYSRLTKFFRQMISKQQVVDLSLASRMITRWLPAVRAVELYMARIDGNGITAEDGQKQKRIYFEKVAL